MAAIVYTVAEPTVAPIVPLQSHGNHRVRVVHLTNDGGTVTAGGDTITAAQVGLTRIEYGDANIHTQGATTPVETVAIVPQSDGSCKIKQFKSADGAELATVAPGAAQVVQARFYGKN